MSDLTADTLADLLLALSERVAIDHIAARQQHLDAIERELQVMLMDIMTMRW